MCFLWGTNWAFISQKTPSSSSTFLLALVCCHGYTEVKASLYHSREDGARVQQARNGVGMRSPIAHGCAARESQTRIPSIPYAATLLSFSLGLNTGTVNLVSYYLLCCNSTVKSIVIKRTKLSHKHKSSITCCGLYFGKQWLYMWRYPNTCFLQPT
jgi:hypothetical protein